MATNKTDAVPEYFEIEASEGETPENRVYYVIGGEKVSIPKMQFITGEVSDFMDSETANRTMSEFGFTRTIFRMLDPEHAGEYTKLANDQIGKLSGAWVTASTVSLGESSASDGS